MSLVLESVFTEYINWEDLDFSFTISSVLSVDPSFTTTRNFGGALCLKMESIVAPMVAAPSLVTMQHQ